MRVNTSTAKALAYFDINYARTSVISTQDLRTKTTYSPSTNDTLGKPHGITVVEKICTPCSPPQNQSLSARISLRA